MTSKYFAARVGIAAITLTALGLAAATPAAAHTNNMFTLIEFDEQTEQTGFATYSKTDGSTAFLGTTFPAERLYVAGIEVFDERGVLLGAGGEESPFVQPWDHKTGAVAEAMSVYVAAIDSELFEIVGLDTLNNGTTITVAGYEARESEEGPYEDYVDILSVNVGTGELVPLVQLRDALAVEDELQYEPTGIATDPLTGITYVFLQDAESSEPYFIAVDVAAGTVGSPTLFQGTYFGAGEVRGADFDADGSLYFNLDNYPEDELQLLKFAKQSDWATGEPLYISTAPAEQGLRFIYEQALTIEHTALAATGSELPIVAWLLVGTAAVVAGGATVMVARRRSETGTV